MTATKYALNNTTNGNGYSLGINRGMTLASGDTYLSGASALYFAVGGETTPSILPLVHFHPSL